MQADRHLGKHLATGVAILAREVGEDVAAGDGVPTGGCSIEQAKLVLPLDPGTVLGDTQEGLVALAHVLGNDLVDADDHVLVAGLLAK